jgi:glycogen debranching enzyme
MAGVNSSFGPTSVNLSEAALLKAGNVYSVTQPDGSLPLGGAHPYGLYMDDCRYLSGYALELAGEPLVSLATADAGPATLVHELTNPELDGLPAQTVGVRVRRRLHPGGMTDEITVSAYGRPVKATLELRVEADFAPMLAVRGLIADGAPPPERDGDRFERTGRDGVIRSTTVRGPLVRELDLAAGETEILTAQFELAPAPRAKRAAIQPTATLRTGDTRTQQLLDRAFADLRSLTSTLDGKAYYSAGIPWYATLFGRDSLITAHQMLAFAPGIAEDTLRLLAAHLGTRDDRIHEEQPGKVLHELRIGEVAGAELTPLARYYGTVDATPLWLCVLADHAEWTGDLGLFRELRPQVDAMLGWLGGGLLEYEARAPGGLRNQGWKDSAEAVCHEDGTWLEPPIALVEAQGYAIAARRGIARLLERAGETEAAARLRSAAAAHAERLERLWLPDRGYYAMALDGHGEPSRALASNQGHLLWARAVEPGRAAAVRDALTGDALFSGWGIRTLAAGTPAYNPVAYHLGSVWPHDTAMSAGGLRAYGFDDPFLRVFEALLDAAANSANGRLPELFAGHARGTLAKPVPYPVSCQPQAWAAGAIPYLTGQALGLEPDGFAGVLHVRRPLLPRGVDRLDIVGLRLAGRSGDLSFARDATGQVALVTVGGDLEVRSDGPR